MAIYRFAMKHGSRGNGKSGKAHASYILRQDSYTYRAHELIHAESGNLPSWATDAIHFWSAADKYEAGNARIYSEFEIALPRELTHEQNIKLVRDFVTAEIGDQHPYTFAVHDVDAMDGGSNPHVHLMFSTRTLDGIERSEELFFKRANKKQPEEGGAAKERSWIKKSRLEELRASWQDHANSALKRAGQAIAIDHRTLESQSIERPPEPKLTPYESMLWKQGVFSEKVEEILALREISSLQERQEANERTLTRLRELSILKHSETRIAKTLAEQQTLLKSALSERDILDQAIGRYDNTLSFAPGSREDADAMAKERLYGRALEAHSHSLSYRRAERDRIAKDIETHIKQGWGVLKDLPQILSESVELMDAQQRVNAARTAYDQYLEEMESSEAREKCDHFAEQLYASKEEDELKRNQLVDDALSIRTRITLYETLIAETEGMLSNIQQEIQQEEYQLSPMMQLAIGLNEHQIIVGQTLNETDIHESQSQKRELKQQLSLKLAQDTEA
ncbi:MAG: MobA/MobL family protein [Cyanobacteria bacterium P01_E01_bin.6]